MMRKGNADGAQPRPAAATAEGVTVRLIVVCSECECACPAAA